MLPSIEIKVDTADVGRLLAMIDRARSALGHGMREAVTWGGVMLAKSLAARTTLSKKKRDVVDLPIQRVTIKGVADRRYAPWGVKKWFGGRQIVRPLYRTGKYGTTFYKSKSEAMGDRRVKIGRRGLAKRSWSWAAANMILGGTSSDMGVSDVASVEWSGGYENPAVRITNRLRYVENALHGGYSAIQSAMNAAANRMEHEIARRLNETLGVA